MADSDASDVSRPELKNINKFRKRIYVSGPISSGDEEENVQRGLQVGQILLEQGYAPLTPHLDYFYPDRTKFSWSQFLEMDLAWVAVADAVLRMPGYSPGADRECEYAASLGIPVFNSIIDLTWKMPARSGTKEIIGLIGYAGAGKDTVAEILYPYGYSRIAFADALKGVASVIGWSGQKRLPSELPWPHDEMGHCDACGMMQDRSLLQYLGTEGIRKNLWDSAWIDTVMRKIQESSDRKWVVTDVRFHNEAKAIRSRGGTIWRINRYPRTADMHVSEIGQDSIEADFTIDNTRSMSDLRQTVIDLVRKK